jgi:pSer/pThr/pTyr-binding forkhead associated (FHA) protein
MMVRPGRMTMGRSRDNDVVVDSLLVSRRHAQIECSGGQCTVEDLGSANGLYVNGRRVPRAVLTAGDRLRLADVELVYQVAGAGPTGATLEMAGRRRPLPAAGTSIGRSRDNDLWIGDERASRHHARIDLEYGVFVISDLGSANGTYVNGQRVQRQALNDGDEIRIGDSRLTFHG